MAAATTIDVSRLSKSFGQVNAVSDLSFRVEPGQVTGFLGPNGAGKTTTLRTLLGLVAPSSGTATFGGVPYRDLPDPLATVGTALEASSFHPGRTAHDHLAVYARSAGVDRSRVDRVLAQVGLTAVGKRRVGGFSLGMRQRLGLAFALLGDPRVLVLDEPVNGLDPEGIRWIRGFLQQLASEGRTVLVSSHLLSEVQQSVDRAVIISKGRLVYEGTLAGLETGTRVAVDAPDRAALLSALLAAGADVQQTADSLVVTGADASRVGEIAQHAGVPLSHLAAEQAGLEEAFLRLVGSDTPGSPS
ncbi:ABC-2 type transport system ATP-binding protein [Conyzicola lurida]|uniref:ABC-2 type transport system ATP-binding protein n=1 Tax=Conyzicola lurida TaxID=1172621 RepID=A0A841AFN1_9MICO|nr:ATP-binding cassette domain-containing protein [Conyzicola lurida]MBB5842590.1 ABC-2 type transport system ATP-binding protein [Conyzicola lurida]